MTVARSSRSRRTTVHARWFRKQAWIVFACVEINQCGCTSHFSAMARPSWLGRAARNEHRHAIETRRKILISTQAADGELEALEPLLVPFQAPGHVLLDLGVLLGVRVDVRALARLVDDVVLALEGRVPRVEDRLERRVVAALPRLHGGERVLGLGRGAPPTQRRARALRRQVREVDPVRVPVRRVVPYFGIAHLAQDAVDELIFKIAVADGLARQIRREGRVADLRRHDLGGPQLRVRPVDGRGPVGKVRRHEAHVVDLVVAHQ